MTKSIEERFEESFKYGGNSQYLDHLYEQYIQDPSKIKPEWKKYFDSIQNGQNDQSHKLIIEKFRNKKVTIKKPLPSTESSKSSDVQNLINNAVNIFQLNNVMYDFPILKFIKIVIHLIP